jgi:hypothetical protein
VFHTGFLLGLVLLLQPLVEFLDALLQAFRIHLPRAIPTPYFLVFFIVLGLLFGIGLLDLTQQLLDLLPHALVVLIFAFGSYHLMLIGICFDFDLLVPSTK